MEIALPQPLATVAPKKSSCGFLDDMPMWL
jgi:hypothetical protein